MTKLNKLGTVATTVSGDSGTTDVTYHQTKVVSFNDKSITLRTGGWKTVTTKTRMNQAAGQFHLGFRVSVRDGQWAVTTPRGDVLPFNGKEITFTRAGELVA